MEECFGVLLTQMEDGRAARVGQFRDMKRRSFFAVLALHRQKFFYRFAVASWGVSISVSSQSGDAVGRVNIESPGRKIAE